MNRLREFIKLLQEAEYSEENGPSLNLDVKYTNEDKLYWGWPLPKGEYFTEEGLLDPGLGSGPVNYEDIVKVRVLSMPRHKGNDESTENYKRRYMYFLNKVSGLDDIVIKNDYVEWNKST